MDMREVRELRRLRRRRMPRHCKCGNCLYGILWEELRHYFRERTYFELKDMVALEHKYSVCILAKQLEQPAPEVGG